MSRGSNRNKVGGVTTNKKTKIRGNDIDTLNLPILVGVLVTIMCLLVVSIRSCTNLRGALTMMNPNSMPGQKGMNINFNSGGSSGGVPIMSPRVVQRGTANNSMQSVNVAYPPGYSPANRQKRRVQNPPKKHKTKPILIKKETIAETVVSETNFGIPREHNYVKEDARRGGIPKSSLSKSSSPEYSFYTYDSHTGSFHLKEEHASYPNQIERVKPSSRYMDACFQSSLSLSGNYLPSRCKYGDGYGFSDLITLRSAIEELNTAYEQSVTTYLNYHRAVAEYTKILSENSHYVIQSPTPLPQYMIDFLEVTPDPFVICPSAHLRSAIHDRGRGRHGPIYINAEEVVIECVNCIIDAPATHISFGPLAKKVVVRGLSLMGATETSVVLREHGAEALFEDCVFIRNEGVGAQGAIADLNSTSSVKFHRCEISDTHHGPNRHVQQGTTNQQYHSLTIRGSSAN